MRVAYLAAGAANMFCGSCLRDNALARELIRQGCETLLIPTYTPIRTDEEDVSVDTVFLGGINMFLQEKYSLFRYLPRWLDRWLDQPWLLRWVAGFGMRTDARDLANLTVSVLQGEHGHQRKEFARLLDFLRDTIRPDLVNLSNLLIGGIIPMIKRELSVPVVVTLQGDDLFLNDLPEPQRTKALEEIRTLDPYVDTYITFSQYYADYMTDLLGLKPGRFQFVPLGLGADEFAAHAAPSSHLGPVAGSSAPLMSGRAAAGSDAPATMEAAPGALEAPPTVGYLARICPAKGFHLLVEAVTRLKQRPGMERVRLRAAGWLGENDAEFFATQQQAIARAGWASDFTYAGVIDRAAKATFLRSMDVLALPTTYREPKGLPVLEALACGVPVVVPAHGAFPELLASLGGGRLFPPGDIDALTDILAALLQAPADRAALAEAGRSAVVQHHTAAKMAEKTLAIYRGLTDAADA